MTNLQLSTAIRNSMLTTFAQQVGAAPRLVVYEGTKPANTSVVPLSTNELVEFFFPTVWATPANNATISLNTTPLTSEPAFRTGNPSYFRLWNNNKTVCHLQGDINSLIISTRGIREGFDIQLTSWTLSLPGN